MTERRVPRRGTVRLLGVIAGTAALVVATIVVGAMTPGYGPMADTVSRLGSAGQPHALAMQSAFVVYGLLVLLGAAPLGDAAPTRERWLTAAVATYALAGVLAGLAPKDPPDVASTTASEVHVAATIVGGAAILLAMALVARHGARRADRFLAVVVAAGTSIGVLVFRFSWGSWFYGLVERSFLALAMLWLVALAVRLLAGAGAGRANGARARQ